MTSTDRYIGQSINAFIYDGQSTIAFIYNVPYT